jgi:hypothetical protein
MVHMFPPDAYIRAMDIVLATPLSLTTQLERPSIPLPPLIHTLKFVVIYSRPDLVSDDLCRKDGRFSMGPRPLVLSYFPGFLV